MIRTRGLSNVEVETWVATSGKVFVLAVVLVIMRNFGGEDWEGLGAASGALALATMGLSLLWGHSHLISLGQNAFMALGGYLFAILTVDHGLVPEVAILLGFLASAVLAVLLGLLASRLGHLYLAIATLGVGLLATSAAVAMRDITGGQSGFFDIPDFQFAGVHLESDRDYYIVGWSLALACGFALARFTVTRTGLAWRLLGDYPDLAQSVGVAVGVQRVVVFVISALPAAVAGAIYASYFSVITPTLFAPTIVLSMLTFLIVGGRSPFGAIVGVCAVQFLVPKIARTGEDAEIVYGAALLLVLFVLPLGLTGLMGRMGRFVRSWLGERSFGRRAASLPERDANESSAAVGTASDRPRPEVSTGVAVSAGRVGVRCRGARGSPVLVVRDVSKSFGGIRALSEVGMTVEHGEVVGLIGANGAGKTTLLNVVCGSLKADSGQVEWLGRVISNLPNYRRSRLGMVRTFQTPQFVPDLTVLENIALGGYRLDIPARGRPGARYREILERTRALGRNFGIEESLGTPATDVPFAVLRLAEFARAELAEPALLCLDEAASGLDDASRDVLRQRIRRLARLGVSVIVVEHDTDFVGSVADRVVALDEGRKIAEGSGQHVFSSPEVLTSYLGVESVQAELPVADAP